MMTRFLALALVLLWAGAAAAQSTSLNVNITVTHTAAGLCGTPPPVAAANGFTTNALCSDWTQPMPPNWLGGCAVAGNGAQTNPFDTTGHNWYNNIWWSNTNQNCTSVQRADPVFGNLALDMPWTSNSNNQQIGMTLQSASALSTDTSDTSHGITLPNNFYISAVYRATPIAQGVYGAFWTWPLLAMTDSTNQAGNELDVIELDTGNLNDSDSAYHNWLLNNFGPWVWQGICGHGATPIGLPCNFDPTQYHEFSSLMTSDGVNNMVCSYVDGVLTNACTPSPGGFTPVQAVARYFLLLQNACDWWNYPSNFCNAGLNQHMYVKNVQAWSCASWVTTQCNNSGPPPPPNGPNQLAQVWTSLNATQTVTTAPDGTTPALLITQDTSTPINHGVTQTLSTPTTPATFGANIAPGSGSGATSVQMLVCSGSSLSPCSDGVGAFFNPTTGALLKTATGNANDHFLGSGFMPVAGGGFHVWFSYSMPASAQVTALVATGAQATGDGTSSTKVWNWALETGLNAPTDGIGPVAIPPGFYVATTGNDSNAGTFGAPFATLGKCQTAMQGSATKTCYIRPGTYAPPRFTGTGEVCVFDNDGTGSGHYADGTRAGTLLALTSADNGETWSNYPGDQSGWTGGVSTVILDGGSTAGQSGDQKNGPIVGSANGVGCGFTLSGTNNITIQGLQFQRFVWSAVWGQNALNFTFKNNTVHNLTGATFVAGAVAGVGFNASTSLNWTITNNYFHDLAYTATEVVGETTGSTSGITVQNNFVKNVCTWLDTGVNDSNGGDCGGIYFEDSNGTAGQANNIKVTNNYVQDVNAGSNGAGKFGDCCGIAVYMDNDASNSTISGNVLIGNKSSGVLIHGGSSNVISGNLIDLDFPSALGGNINNIYGSNNGVASGTGNQIHNNIFVSNSNVAGAGFYRDGSSMPVATVANNFYHNYNGSSVATSGGFGTDSHPVQPAGDPGISCWSPAIAGGSAVFASPVSFPGLTGGWGPPGFVIPQTGTAPSWPHAC